METNTHQQKLSKIGDSYYCILFRDKREPIYLESSRAIAMMESQTTMKKFTDKDDKIRFINVADVIDCRYDADYTIIKNNKLSDRSYKFFKCVEIATNTPKVKKVFDVSKIDKNVYRIESEFIQ